MLEVQYTSKRSEVWSWYWRSWREWIWKVHAVLFFALTISFFVLVGGPSHPLSGILVSNGLAVGALAFMAIYPQLRFKPERRSLVLNDNGLSTKIGRKTGSRSWREIKSVAEEMGYVVITAKNRNAFIIPPRAFDGSEERDNFLAFAHAALVNFKA
jgi:hypothetical protein